MNLGDVTMEAETGERPDLAIDPTGPTDWPRGFAWLLIAIVIVEVLIAVIGAALQHVPWRQEVGSYLVTNVAIGAGFAVPGAILALYRRRNPIGWLLLAAGIAHLTTAATTSIIAARAWSGPGLRVLGSIYMFAWPWGIGVALPITLLLFPTGALVSRRWRPVLWCAIVGDVLFVASQSLDPTPQIVNGRIVPTYLGLPFFHRLGPLWAFVNGYPAIVIAAAIVALILRYRRGDEKQRRQLLWLVYAAALVIVLNLQRWTVGNGPILLLLATPLVPIAIAIAIVRYQLLDIRLVVARTAAYAVLTAGVVAAYAGGVAALDRVVTGFGAPVLTTLAIALAFNPVRVRLQNTADRLLYGSRSDPVRTVSRVRARLAADDLAGVLDGARDSLRLPFLALRRDGREVAASGTPPETLHVVPLGFRGADVGEFIVGIRVGDSRLGAADIAVLDLLAAPLASALYASGLAEALQTSRERIVSAREEERRRLHRDLHDGLGPTLTGAALKADAATNLIATDPTAATALVAGLRADIGDAIADVRRVVYGLRPPALDEIGLTGALRRHCASLPLQVDLAAPDPMPALPAAVEVAAFRIITEALTNVARHTNARTVQIELTIDDALRLSIIDDGPDVGEWVAGVGLTSMRERAAELGGTCAVGPTGHGGMVSAMLPLGSRS
ncbi:MAG TPA: histidine kinase [Micromonosporaceae bacterium]